jgi:hypothetical protein
LAFGSAARYSSERLPHPRAQPASIATPSSKGRGNLLPQVDRS